VALDYTTVYSDMSLEYMLQKNNYNSNEAVLMIGQMSAFSPLFLSYFPTYIKDVSTDHPKEVEQRVALRRFQRTGVTLYQKALKGRGTINKYFNQEVISEDELKVVVADADFLKKALQEKLEVFPHQVLVETSKFTGWATGG